LYFAKNLTQYAKGAKIYLKREDLNHTGAHKINNSIGQILLAKYLNKKRIIAETGAGQHGVATATAARLLNFPCEVYMGQEDIERQALNVFKMELLGAKVIPVHSGSKTLKDAINETIRYWVAHSDDTYYLIGSAVGPHPYPMIVRDFQKIIGEETKRQFKKLKNKLPDYLVACVGGGSNAMGIFYPFLNDKSVKFIGVEAGGLGIHTTKHAATLSVKKTEIGILHGAKSYLLQDKEGQIHPTHSISAGLDYPGVGPEHSFFKDTKRAEYVAISDNEALNAFMLLSKLEGIIPALESSHAVAYGLKLAKTLSSSKNIIINLSGRGDKDIHTVQEYLKNRKKL